VNRYAAVLFIAVSIPRTAMAADVTPAGIPQRPDPPFAIDGDLADWASVPNTLTFTNQDQVVWGASAWKAVEDLSATALIAWRAEHLYVAAAVGDDVLAQSQHGDGIWRGDHIELYLDAAPESEPARDPFGEGQYQLAFSPGNFGQTGDPLTDSKPEAFCYRPAGGSVEGIRVAAKRLETGWAIEAAIPWRIFNIENAQIGLPLRFELGISDTDSQEPQQECLMTISNDKWGHTRSRLVPAVLAGADGVPPAAATAAEVLSELHVPCAENRRVEFACPAAPSGKIPVLSMNARLQFDSVAGYTTAMRLVLNDAPILADRLMNKPLRVKARGGDVYSMSAIEAFSVFYSPDFVSPELDPHYGLLDGVKACEFEFNVDGLLKEGANTLSIEHVAPTVNCNLVVANGRIAFRTPPPPEKQKAGPPLGPLPVYKPRLNLRTEFTAQEEPDSRLSVTIAGETFVVESQFSSPAPEWVRGSCGYFSLNRRIERNPEVVVIHDTFTNLTDENLPIMRRNQILLGDRLQRLWLAGLEQHSDTTTQANPANPTTYAAAGKFGIGLLPLDDVSRLHALNYAANGAVGLADNNLVLRPRSSYTAEWAVVPTDTPDYWTFINAARRLVDANFTIDGAFAFLRADMHTDPWTDTQLADFIRYKDARYVCASLTYPMYKGRYCHGTSFQLVPHDNFVNSFQRWRKLAPDAKFLCYFHCFIDVTDDGPERFQDARLLQPDGTQADYGQPYDRIYFPTEANYYGSVVIKNVNIILDEIGADGVYWDEHEYSRYLYHYGDPWDGFTGDIDAGDMKIRRLKSSVTLLTEPWRLALAKRILARGPLIGNGPPFTRAMAALKFPCFVETDSITHCTQAHLYSPIALGDHLTERSEIDAYRQMLAALEYGCVYHWYNDLTVIPTHPHLTRYMYPITPVELHQGYVVGKERIVTKISGLFGWADASRHEVHVFDDSGKEAAGFSAPQVSKDGNSYTELRLPEDWAAVIVRK